MKRALRFLFLLLLAGSFKTEQPDYYGVPLERFVQLPELKHFVDARKPDYELLDAAIFHLTNQARSKFGLKLLRYDPGLHQTAQGYATDMIQMGFYGHTHPYSPSLATISDRVKVHTWAFLRKGENIGQYQVIDTTPTYCCRKKRDGTFEYMECESKAVFSPYTYEGFAEYAIGEWMKSPGHRRNVLDSTYTHLGCSARISKDPYEACSAPFGRFVQNFGAIKPEVVK
ncbi:CAP domain-containing protein [Runella sp.]|uniref:CAP domain-containing protein n=1 Tax=Runella sp. TaxID=1960881 RepID=UPI003D09D572